MTAKQARTEPLPSDGRELDYKKLVQDVLAGNQEATNTLYWKLHVMVRRLASKYQSSMPGFELQSLIDQCFGYLVRGDRYSARGGIRQGQIPLASWRGETEASLFKFVKTAVGYHLIDWLRQNKKRFEEYRITDGLPESDVAPTGSEPGPATLQVELEEEQLIRILREAYDELPAHTRELLVWKFNKGLSELRIAELLDISRRMAKRRLDQAVEDLARKMEAKELERIRRVA